MRPRLLHNHNRELELHGVFGGQNRGDEKLDKLYRMLDWEVSGCFGTKFMPELL